MVECICSLQLAVPPADWPGHKTLALTVTPFLKSCRKENRKFRFASKINKPSFVIFYMWNCLKPFDLQALLLLNSAMHPKRIVLRRPGQLCLGRLQALGRGLMHFNQLAAAGFEI